MDERDADAILRPWWEGAAVTVGPEQLVAHAAACLRQALPAASDDAIARFVERYSAALGVRR
jgi:hypothetical protein